MKKRHFARLADSCTRRFKGSGTCPIICTILLLGIIGGPVLYGQDYYKPNKVSDDRIFRAIRSGSSDSLAQIISKGADVNASQNDISPLMAAALYGTREQMSLLIDHGALVNWANADSLTALWLAVPDWDKTSLLLAHGADPRMESRQHYSVLVKLVSFPGTLNLLRLLIEKGADPKQASPDNLLMYNAAGSCDTAIVGELLNYGLSVNDTIFSGDYPINSALNYRCADVVKMLVDHGANVNVAPMHLSLDLVNGITPLMFAAVSNDKSSFYYLLDHGANPNAKSKNGQTPLMFLMQCEVDDPDMTRALLSKGVSAKDKARDGSDALYYALKRGNTPSVNLLREYLNK